MIAGWRLAAVDQPGTDADGGLGGHLWAVWGLVRCPDHHYHVAYKDQLVW
jgi:hypothetical protein